MDAEVPEVSIPPSDIRTGDVLAEATGKGQVLGRPFSTAAGSTVHVRVRKIDQPHLTDLLTWPAHERVSVKRASAEEGKR